MATIKLTPYALKNPDLLIRFLGKVHQGSGCWEWAAGLFGLTEYGGFTVANVRQRAHRVSWLLFRGEILDDLYVLHKCDNPPCVRPSHLFLGTTQDNTADRDAKGRQASGDRNGARLHPEKVSRGEAHHNAKLTERDIRAIRNDGRAQATIAAAYHMTQANVSMIQLGKSWKHVQ